jgi:hypothetical protein
MATRNKPHHPRFTEETIYQLDCLLEFVSPGDLREYLFEIYHSYIEHEHERLPSDFRTRAQSLQVLFDFLKFMEEEGRLSKR